MTPKIFILSICKLKLSCIEMKAIEQKVWGLRRIKFCVLVVLDL